MQKIAAGLAALFAVASWGPAMGQSVQDQIQQSEQPGSQIEIDIGGGGGVNVHRGNGKPMLGGMGRGGAAIEPAFPDPVDAEMPGEGPESLSGPDDDDPLPY